MIKNPLPCCGSTSAIHNDTCSEPAQAAVRLPPILQEAFETFQQALIDQGMSEVIANLIDGDSRVSTDESRLLLEDSTKELFEAKRIFLTKLVQALWIVDIAKA